MELDLSGRCLDITEVCCVLPESETMSSCDLEERPGQESCSGTPGLKRRSYASSCGSSLVSPETEEFETLEKSFKEELEQKLHERKSSEGERRSCEPRRVSELASLAETEADPPSLQLVEKRQLRSFSRADEYLYAMKEDLAEWLNLLYPVVNIDAENFMDTLQTGEHLLRVSTFPDSFHFADNDTNT